MGRNHNVGSGSLSGRRSQAPKFRLMLELRHLAKRFPQMAKEFPYSWNLVKLLIVLEVVINFIVIHNVRYTEIDWSTYMTQVAKIFNSSSYNFNYTEIDGPTGPLVYPAGHVYIFYLFKELTDGGANILKAQYIFLCIYIAQLILVYKIYSHKSSPKVPPYIFLFMCFCSYRIHSIYILRLFNDPIAILFAYASFYAFLRKKHTLSAFLFSVAVSIKMNILLFAPAFALIFYEEIGLVRSLKNAGLSILTQVILAIPFLYTDAEAYLKNAFNFERVFLHKWTVNWRFLDESTFKSPEFFKLLLAVHLSLLLIMFLFRWLSVLTKLKFNFDSWQRGPFTTHSVTHHFRGNPILTLFIMNFIGVACSRTLHYQFYVWYYHSLPMILWYTRYSVVTKLLILGCIEFAWNVYPSTKFSSLLLHASHVAILLGLLISMNKRILNVIFKNNRKTGKQGRGHKSH